MAHPSLKTEIMNTEIEIIRTDEANHKAVIIGMNNDKMTINNTTLGTIEFWDLEDIKRCMMFV